MLLGLALKETTEPDFVGQKCPDEVRIVFPPLSVTRDEIGNTPGIIKTTRSYSVLGEQVIDEGT